MTDRVAPVRRESDAAGESWRKWTDRADPLQPPETGYVATFRFARDPDGEWYALDAELLPDPHAGIDLLDGAVVATSAWLVLTTLTAAALVAVLALLALRRHRS